MHRLFPEKVPENDPTGHETWEHDRWVANTGSKWSPEIYIAESVVDEVTLLTYDSAWTPNNGTLQRLHDKTGWAIRNEYREEGMQVAGCFVCESGQCQDQEREYLTVCEICEEGKPDSDYDEELDGLICNQCRKSKGLTEPIDTDLSSRLKQIVCEKNSLRNAVAYDALRSHHPEQYFRTLDGMSP